MDLLATARRLDGIPAQYLSDEVEPAAGLRRVSQAVNAGRPQGADRPVLAQTVAVDERLQRRLVGAVVAGRPQWVRLVQGPVVQDHLMDRTRRNEDEPLDTALHGRLE